MAIFKNCFEELFSQMLSNMLKTFYIIYINLGFNQNLATIEKKKNVN